MSTTFIKKTENFTCEVCGEEVKGDGYTDHCPNCLCGKHVDINPGDRKSECGGLMEPIGIEIKNGQNTIRYKCRKCSQTYRVRASKNDNTDIILELSTR
ncbi:MAG: RNHCP domain-containing protein [bacterium]